MRKTHAQTSCTDALEDEKLNGLHGTMRFDARQDIAQVFTELVLGNPSFAPE
jgi:hypothetical protein